jgi:hypothetical protein
MNYFKFGVDIDTTKVKKNIFQVICEKDWEMKYPETYHFIFKDGIKEFIHGVYPKNDLNFSFLYLDKNIELTDILYGFNYGNYFVINEKIIEIFSKFNLPKHKFYKLELQRKDKKGRKIGGKVDGYYYFCFQQETGESVLNYEKSIFIKDETFHYKFMDYPIKNYHDYMTIFNATGRSIIAKKAVFNKNFNIELDFLGACYFSVYNYISERLLDAFKKENVTGYSIGYKFYDYRTEFEFE